MINIPKGLKDVLPTESFKWQRLEAIARDVCKTFNVHEIRTPVFEYTELFQRGVGDTTDIVTKEMYTFTDRGDHSITLKPEGTAGVARCFIEKNLTELCSLPVKMYYFTPVFRYENPQNGRLREHHQFGVELYGAMGASMDFEAIQILNTFLNRAGVTDCELNLNSIGCPDCRKDYSLALINHFNSHKSDICSLCAERLNRNPLRVLDCKNPACKKIADSAPKITGYLCEDCKAHFETLKGMLNEAGIAYRLNPNIVRGLDYYTRTVFEFISGKEGCQGTLSGGGRYNTLIEQLGGKPVGAVGFGLGLERLLMHLGNEGEQGEGVTIFIANISNEYLPSIMRMADLLRKCNISTDYNHIDRSLKSQLRYADKINAQNVIVVGEDEVSNARYNLKNMKTGVSELMSIEEIINKLKKE